MKFRMMRRLDEAACAALPADEPAEGHAAFMAFAKAMDEAEATTAGGRLHPVARTATVAVRGGFASTAEGPLQANPGRPGGFHLVDAADRGEARARAARRPAALGGAAERRRLMQLA